MSVEENIETSFPYETALASFKYYCRYYNRIPFDNDILKKEELAVWFETNVLNIIWSEVFLSLLGVPIPNYDY